MKKVYVIRYHQSDNVIVLDDFDELFKAVKYITGVDDDKRDDIRYAIEEFHKWVILPVSETKCKITVYWREIIEEW